MDANPVARLRPASIFVDSRNAVLDCQIQRLAWRICQSARAFSNQLTLVFLCLALASCTGKGNAAPTAYLPPTPVGAPLAATQPVVVYQPPAAPQCVDNLYYLQDLTIPDGSPVAPGSALDKQWLVENNGDCNWDAGYRLRLIAGPDLGAPAEQTLYPARSGTQAVIRILFTAPAEAGTYRSAWQAYDPQGIPFGDPIFIEIVVQP